MTSCSTLRDVLGRAERVGDVDDRVADELARAVVGDVAAAPDGDELGADGGRVAAQVVARSARGPWVNTCGCSSSSRCCSAPVVEQRLLHRERLAVRHACRASGRAARSRRSSALRTHSSADQSLVSRISLIR